MAAPWYAYVMGLLFVLPVYILVGALLVLVARLFVMWLADDGSAPGSKMRVSTKAKATLKG